MMNGHHHADKKCTSATCCSPSKIWKAIQTAIATDDKDGIVKLCQQDPDRTVQVKDVLLTSRLHNDASLYPPSHKHRVLQFDKSIRREATTLFGKSVTDLNALQVALFQEKEDMGLQVLTFLRQHAAQPSEIQSFVNHVWGQRNTSLHLACYYGMPRLVRLLLELGADPNAVNERQIKPIDCSKDPECRAAIENAMAAATVTVITPPQSPTVRKSPSPSAKALKRPGSPIESAMTLKSSKIRTTKPDTMTLMLKSGPMVTEPGTSLSPPVVASKGVDAETQTDRIAGPAIPSFLQQTLDPEALDCGKLVVVGQGGTFIPLGQAPDKPQGDLLDNSGTGQAPLSVALGQAPDKPGSVDQASDTSTGQVSLSVLAAQAPDNLASLAQEPSLCEQAPDLKEDTSCKDQGPTLLTEQASADCNEQGPPLVEQAHSIWRDQGPSLAEQVPSFGNDQGPPILVQASFTGSDQGNSLARQPPSIWSDQGPSLTDSICKEQGPPPLLDQVTDTRKLAPDTRSNPSDHVPDTSTVRKIASDDDQAWKQAPDGSPFLWTRRQASDGVPAGHLGTRHRPFHDPGEDARTTAVTPLHYLVIQTLLLAAAEHRSLFHGHPTRTTDYGLFGAQPVAVS